MDYNDVSSPVCVKKDGHIGFLLLNRVHKKNAMSEAMWRAFPDAVKSLDGDPDVRVILVSSIDEGAFSAGADIAELGEIAADKARQESNRQAIRNAQRCLARAKKPTIAMIYGACMGGGCGLAIHCDMRFAAPEARFAITPAKLGIVYPLNDTKQLIDLVGPAKAKSMLFTGRVLGAEEAETIGLVDAVVPKKQLRQHTLEFAHQIASVSQFSVQAMKKFVQRVLDGQEDDDAETAAIFKDAQEGIDAEEGIKAFLEKRKPAFRWNGD